jgi:hypothetical protein
MPRHSFLFVMACWLAIVPQASQGQHFSIGISTGHHGHHHGWHHWHGPCWPAPCYGPAFGFVYAPPTIVRERVVYVQPARTNVWTAPVNPAVTSAPAASTVESTAETQITIRNGAGVQLPVAFLVDGQDIELKDGEARAFFGSARRTVRYDRGGRFGSTQQELTAGEYEFRVTASGWDLVRRPEGSTAAANRTAVRTNALPR